jgi:hypothetical protein
VAKYVTLKEFKRQYGVLMQKERDKVRKANKKRKEASKRNSWKQGNKS